VKATWRECKCGCCPQRKRRPESLLIAARSGPRAEFELPPGPECIRYAGTPSDGVTITNAHMFSNLDEL
jgi:hypothetical protein